MPKESIQSNFNSLPNKLIVSLRISRKELLIRKKAKKFSKLKRYMESKQGTPTSQICSERNGYCRFSKS